MLTNYFYVLAQVFGVIGIVNGACLIIWSFALWGDRRYKVGDEWQPLLIGLFLLLFCIPLVITLGLSGVPR